MATRTRKQTAATLDAYPTKETAMPITMTVDPAPEPVTPLILTDDISDPPVPPGTIEAQTPVPDSPPPPNVSTGTPAPSNGTVPVLPDALLPLAHGFCQYVQAQLTAKLDEAGRRMTKDVDMTMSEMATYTKGVMGAYAPTPTPYSVVVHAATPSGLPCTFTVQKPTSSELIEELGRMVGWLEAHGYTAAEVMA